MPLINRCYRQSYQAQSAAARLHIMLTHCKNRIHCKNRETVFVAVPDLQHHKILEKRHTALQHWIKPVRPTKHLRGPADHIKSKRGTVLGTQTKKGSHTEKPKMRRQMLSYKNLCVRSSTYITRGLEHQKWSNSFLALAAGPAARWTQNQHPCHWFSSWYDTTEAQPTIFVCKYSRSLPLPFVHVSQIYLLMTSLTSNLYLLACWKCRSANKIEL